MLYIVLPRFDCFSTVGKYDFLYVPMKFLTRLPFGYAFVNLTSPDAVREFWLTFDGFDLYGATLAVGWSKEIQGLDEQIERA